MGRQAPDESMDHIALQADARSPTFVTSAGDFAASYSSPSRFCSPPGLHLRPLTPPS